MGTQASDSIDFGSIIERVEGRERRLSAFWAAEDALAPDEWEYAFAMMAKRAKSRLTPSRSGDAVMSRATASEQPAKIVVEIGQPEVTSEGSKTDLAEKLVLGQPGITTSVVAARINQSTSVAKRTLERVADTRKSIKRKGSAWYPVDKKPPADDGGSVIENAIAAVLADGQPRTTGDIRRAVAARYPSINLDSVGMQISRMARSNPPRLVTRGFETIGERKIGMYVLASPQPKTSVNGAE